MYNNASSRMQSYFSYPVKSDYNIVLLCYCISRPEVKSHCIRQCGFRFRCNLAAALRHCTLLFSTLRRIPTQAQTVAAYLYLRINPAFFDRGPFNAYLTNISANDYARRTTSMQRRIRAVPLLLSQLSIPPSPPHFRKSLLSVQPKVTLVILGACSYFGSRIGLVQCLVMVSYCFPKLSRSAAHRLGWQQRRLRFPPIHARK